MDDIHVFIILFLALVFLCRATKEGFEEMKPGGMPVDEQDTPPEAPPVESGDDGEEEVIEEEVIEEEVIEEEVPGKVGGPVPGKPPPQQNGDNGLHGWDKRRIFSSPMAPNFGSLLELKDIQQLNNLFSKRNTDINVPPQPTDSQMPSLSQGSTVPNMLGQPENSGNGGNGGGSVELHMVYAEWCGHSQNALGAFEGLVDKTDVKTSAGKTVKFVLTEQSSDEFKEFKGKVKGFPSYVVKDGGEMNEVDVGDRSESAIIDAAKKL